MSRQLMVLDWLPLRCRSLVAVHLNARSDEVGCIHVYRERASRVKYTTLLLLLGLSLLPHAVLADQAHVAVCVNALEQLEALKTVAPVYKLTRGQQRQYIADTDRPAEVARLKTIVADSCSEKPEYRQREESEAGQLHLVRSPGCMQDRERLTMIEKKDARTPEDDLARTRKRVLAQCPDVDLTDVWLVEWIPIPVSPNG
jgi:hypothetical protein